MMWDGLYTVKWILKIINESFIVTLLMLSDRMSDTEDEDIFSFNSAIPQPRTTGIIHTISFLPTFILSYTVLASSKPFILSSAVIMPLFYPVILS